VPPDLSIVIVNWNTADLLRECLQSVLENAGAIVPEVLVVDNHSSDGSQDMVRQEFPSVRLIANQSNVGFAAANNQAFPECSADLILLLNPDTRVLGEGLAVLVAFMRAHPEAGAIGPKVVHPAGRLRLLSCGYQPTLRTLFNHFSGLSSLFPHSPAFRGLHLVMGRHDDCVRAVEWISGACLLVRKQVIQQAGALSEEWFMYAEDMEWCQRIAAAGWRLYSVPEAVVEHHVGAAASRSKRVSTMWVGSLRSYCVCREPPSFIRLLLLDAVLIAGLGMRALLYFARALVGCRRRDMWRSEARRFATYTWTALSLAVKR
jgi:GT2 family glycosyltransferase